MWAGVVVALASLPGSVTAPAPDTLWDAGVEVPFLAQGPLLCGGAAAAMVERYWGTRGVYGEDFGHLVREAEGGIRATELAAAIRERGYAVDIVSGRPDTAFDALIGGIPPILLLESGATRLHYVVLVEVREGDAWIHDPNFGPRRRMSLAELRSRWTASGYWALFAVPADDEVDDHPRPAEDRRGPDGPSSVAVDAVDLLRDDDLAGARAAARSLLRRDEEDARIGRRILATSWYLDGEPERALDQWNALGEPAIDLVRIDGTGSTRFTLATDRMSLEHGEVLTAGSLRLARRRLAQLPSVETSRVEYRPLPDGTVEVGASVVEHAVVPRPTTMVAQGVNALIQRTATLEVGPIVTGGERWRVAGSWADAQRFVSWSMSTPAPPLPGVATVGMEVRRERFGRDAPGSGTPTRTVDTEERVRAFLGVEEWIDARLRLGLVLGVETWKLPSGSPDPAARVPRVFHGALSGHASTASDEAWMTWTAEGWTGPGTAFGRLGVVAAARIPRGARRAWRVQAGAATVSREAPRTLWPGAGTGRVREPLLRAHTLMEDGVIQGRSLGRHLVHGTVEHRMTLRRLGPFRLGTSIFADAAYVGQRADDGGGTPFVDVGVGVFLGTESREIAVSLAHGAPGWRWSARVGP